MAVAINHKRIYRLMKKHGLLLARHTGRRRQQAHDGKVTTLHSNTRWCSDILEFTCWNGEVVRVAFALDCHDREVISWMATTAGISGEIIRDLMIACVEQRFGAIRTPHPIQWLSDNGSVYAAAKTIDLAIALGLVPCFTPVESPESNGIAEAFVKTFKRDYVRVNPIPDAATALAAVADGWPTTTRFIPTAGSATAHPASIDEPSTNPPRVRSDGGNSNVAARVCLPRANRNLPDRFGTIAIEAACPGRRKRCVAQHRDFEEPRDMRPPEAMRAYAGV